MEKETSGEIDEQEFNTILAFVSSQFNVESSDVNYELYYKTTGTIEIESSKAFGALDMDFIQEMIIDVFADDLEIHRKAIVLTSVSDSIIEFTIRDVDAAIVEDIKLKLQANGKVDDMEDVIEGLTGLTNVHINPQNNFCAMMDITVDMTGTSGLQFNPKSNGDSFTTLIRVNANQGALVTFSLKIWYDEDVLRATGCSKTGSWADKSAESNTESSHGEILLVGKITVINFV